MAVSRMQSTRRARRVRLGLRASAASAIHAWTRRQTGVRYGKYTPDRIDCTTCADGQEPNLAHTACAVCAEGMAGTHGVCDRCSSGQQPSAESTECINCNDPNSFDQGAHGWASAVGLECVACDAGRAPSAATGSATCAHRVSSAQTVCRVGIVLRGRSRT